MSLLISCLMACIGGYLLIKLSGSVPAPVSFVAVMSLIVVSTAAHFLFPLASDCNTKSDQVLKFWSKEGCSKYRRRLLRSCSKLGIWVGPFFKFTKQTRTEYIGLTMYYMLTLLISV
jgi:hypothetical protein